MGVFYWFYPSDMAYLKHPCALAFFFFFFFLFNVISWYSVKTRSYYSIPGATGIHMSWVLRV